MSLSAVAVVFSGAGLGALLRWWLALLLGPLSTTIPLGTLAANLIGGLLVGVASAVFNTHASLPPEWRLLVITGFMGGLTTFSSFSLEVVTMLGRHDYGWALATIGVHLLGSLLLTGLGILIAQALLARI